MTCKEYESLKDDYKMEIEQYAQFTYPQNKHLRGGTSDGQSKRIANAALERANMKEREMASHRAHCTQCNEGSI